MKISVILEALTGSFETDIKRADKAADKAFKQMRKNAEVAAKAMGAAAATAAVVGAGLVKASIDNADATAKMARQIGVSTEFLSTFSHAASLSGVEIDRLKTGFKTLSQRVVESVQGIGEGAKAFDFLGISVKDSSGKIKSSEAIVLEIAQAYEGMADGAVKADNANKLFGRTGLDLIPLLNSGSDAIRKMQDEARALGLEIGSGFAANSEAFNDNLNRMNGLVKGLANSFADEMLPLLVDLTNNFVESGKQGRAAGDGMESFATGVKNVYLGLVIAKNGLDAFVTTIAGLVEIIPEISSAFADLASNMTPIGQIWSRLDGTHRDSGQIIEELTAKIKATGDTVRGGWLQSISDVADAFFSVNQSGKDLAGNLAGSGGKPGVNPELDNTEKEAREAARALAKLEAEARKAQREAEKLAKEAEQLAAEIQGNERAVEDLVAALDGPMAQAILAHDRALEDLSEKYDDGKISLEGYRKGVEAVGEQFDRTTAQIEEQKDVLGAFNARAAEDAALIGLEGRQLAVAQAVQEITRAYQQNVPAAEQTAEGLALVQQGAAATEGALYDLGEETARINALTGELGGAFGDLAYDILDEATTIEEAWDNLGDSLADTAKRAVAQMIQEFFELRVIKPLLQSIFGGSGGGGFNIGSLFGSGGSGGGLNFSSLLGSGGSNPLTSIASFFGFGGGSASALPAFLQGGGVAYSGGIPIAGTTAPLSSVTGGANAAAASTGQGALGGLGAAGIAAIVVAAMMVNDSLYGSGWRSSGGSTTLPNGAEVRGGGDISTLGRVLTGFGPELVDSFLQRLGVSGRIASLISGSSIHTRLFGRKAPRLTDSENTYGFGSQGTFGSERYRTLEEGGVFRSDRRRWHDFDLSEGGQEYANVLQEFVDDVMNDAADRLESEVPDNFEAALRIISKYNKDGTVKSSQFFVDIFGEGIEVASEDEALQRIGAEAIIATIDGFMSNASEAVDEIVRDYGGSAGTGLGETVLRDLKNAEEAQGEAHTIAERWRHDTELLAEGATFLLDAAADINAGFALLGEGSTLTEIADLTEELSNDNEALLDTYKRMVSATRLLDEAISLSGVELDKSREDFVRFATGIAEAAGGIDRASALWSSYFQTFYTEQERAALALSRGRTTASGEFADIGLNLDDFTGEGGAQAFRDMFESLMPTLSEEAFVQWLEAADALGIVLDLQARYNSLLVGTAAAFTNLEDLMSAVDAGLQEFAAEPTFEERMTQLQEEIDALILMAEKYGATELEIDRIRRLGQNRMRVLVEEQEAAAAAAEEALRLQGVAAENLLQTLAVLEAESAAGVTPLTASLMDLRAEYNRTIDTIEDLARASGRAQASEAELAVARNWYQNQVRRLIDELFQHGASLVQQFYGTSVDSLGAGTGFSPIAGAELDGIGNVVEAVENRYERELQLLEQLQQFIDGLTLSSLSPLTPDQRLAEAQAQYEATLAAAMGGDLDALAALPGAAQAYLGEAQSYYGGVGEYPEIFASVLEQLGLITAAGPQSSPGNAAPPQSVFGGPVLVEPGQGFADLSALDRELIATELVEVLRDIVASSNHSLQEISAQLGLDLQDLVEALGVNLSELTVETTLQLADISRNLGVDLIELADGVGFALGDLADSQSLLNDALEQTIDGLPDGIRDNLRTLLANIENATTEADANAAVEEAEAAINALPPEIRDLLAPFFSGVDSPTQNLLAQAIQQTEDLGTIATNSNTQLEKLTNIDANSGTTIARLDDIIYELQNLELAAPSGDLPQVPKAVPTSTPTGLLGETSAIASTEDGGSVVVRMSDLVAMRKAMEDMATTNRQLLHEAKKPQAISRRA